MKDLTPKVSILVTVYNREKYLLETLQSIAALNYSSFEAIIVDDCSTDNSFGIAQSFAEQDLRFRVVKNNKNLGQFRNRNRAAVLANTEYIKYVDSDDSVYKFSLDIMLEALLRFPEASHALCSPVIDPSRPYPLKLTPTEAYRNEFLGRGCLSAGPSGSIIKKKDFDNIGGYRDVGVVSDIDLWYRLSAIHETVLIQPSLIWWRRHEAQASTAQGVAEDYLTGELQIATDALNSPDCPLEKAEKLIALRRKRQHFARRLFKIAWQKQSLSAFRIGKTANLTMSEYFAGLFPYY